MCTYIYICVCTCMHIYYTTIIPRVLGIVVVHKVMQDSCHQQSQARGATGPSKRMSKH